MTDDPLRTLHQLDEDLAKRKAVVSCKAELLATLERHSPDARGQALAELAAVVGGPEELQERLRRLDVEQIELWRSISFVSQQISRLSEAVTTLALRVPLPRKDVP